MKKNVISHLVAAILGFLGGVLGVDLAGLQKPVEKTVEAVIEPAPPPPPAPKVDVPAAEVKVEHDAGTH